MSQKEYNNKVGPELYDKKLKHKWLKLVLFILSIVIFFQIGTQYFADYFQYQEALGASYKHIYAPWKIIEWYMLYGNQYPKVWEDTENVMFISIMIMALITLVVLLFDDYRLKGNKYLHGSAHWASLDDIKHAGLLHDNLKVSKKTPMVYVGAVRDKDGKLRYLTHGGPEHILCFAPTRSGKGVGLVVPTMLSWSASVVCNDIKGELWALT